MQEIAFLVYGLQPEKQQALSECRPLDFVEYDDS
jgi:hypothetical protein